MSRKCGNGKCNRGYRSEDDMKLKTVLQTQNEKPLNPCQLKKIHGSGRIACSMMCAFEHECPVFYIDSHDMPIIKRGFPK